MSEKEVNLFKLLLQLWSHFSSKRRSQFSILIILMILTGFAEIFSLGAVLPFLAVLTDPVGVYENPTFQPILKIFNITSPDELLFPLTVAFVIASVLSGCMRLLQGWANTRVTYSTGADLSVSIYRRTLYQPYMVHVSRNSSSIINAVTNKAMAVIHSGITPTITIATSAIILLSIMLTLIAIDPFVSLTSFVGFGLTYFCIIVVSRRRLKHNSILIAEESNQVVKSLQEGLGGIRDVIIDGSQELYSYVYSQAIFPLYKAQGSNIFIGLSPRFGIESIGMILIATLAYWLVGQPGGFSKAIPILGTLAFGAQRMLPVLQQLYRSWTALQGNAASLKDVLDLLDQPIPQQIDRERKGLKFQDSIKLHKLTFKYNTEGPKVMSDINLEIKKGNKVGFIGATGSGKSTMLDIVMGLLNPTEGSISVDGVIVNDLNRGKWQTNIAHVPQAIFLPDTSVKENIAFGIPIGDIDIERVELAAKQAQINKIIESWPDRYDTPVGERGVRLSGGQRQRIGIARALYKKADVIILDEATSALDNQTESEVMRSIENLDDELTILIIAHRLTTLRNCDFIVELDNGEIIRKGTYEEVVLQHHSSEID